MSRPLKRQRPKSETEIVAELDRVVTKIGKRRRPKPLVAIKLTGVAQHRDVYAHDLPLDPNRDPDVYATKIPLDPNKLTTGWNEADQLIRMHIWDSAAFDRRAPEILLERRRRELADREAIVNDRPPPKLVKTAISAKGSASRSNSTNVWTDKILQEDKRRMDDGNYKKLTDRSRARMVLYPYLTDLKKVGELARLPGWTQVYRTLLASRKRFCAFS